MYFGKRSRTKHVNLRMRDIELKETSTGDIQLYEREAKIRTGVKGDTIEHYPLHVLRQR